MKYNQPRPGFELVSPCPFPTTITIQNYSKITDGLVGWYCRIHWQLLCRGVRLPNACPGYDIKQSDREVLVMPELLGMQSTPSLPSLPGSLSEKQSFISRSSYCSRSSYSVVLIYSVFIFLGETEMLTFVHFWIWLVYNWNWRSIQLNFLVPRPAVLLLWISFNNASRDSFGNCPSLLSSWPLIISFVGLYVILGGFSSRFLCYCFHFWRNSSWLASFSFTLEMLSLPLTSFMLW